MQSGHRTYLNLFFTFVCAWSAMLTAPAAALHHALFASSDALTLAARTIVEPSMR